MSHPLLAALLVASATATAQTPAPSGQTSPAAPAAGPHTPTPPPPGTPEAPGPSTTPPPGPAAPNAPAQPTPPAGTEEAIQREVDKRVEAAKEELREEMRAQLATQNASSEWNQEWTQEKRKLELFTLDGYMRMRPNMFYQFSLGKAPGLSLYPQVSGEPHGKTQAGADMRMRMEPTLNISEEVRVKMQVDALDNILMGSTPSDPFGALNQFSIFGDSQNPPTSSVNALKDSVVVKRAYGEVSTPVGILRFGRMGAHWGLGIVRHDGECLDCDFGDNVDRVQFVTEPFPGWYVTPMLEFGNEGSSLSSSLEASEPVDLSQVDDTTSWVLAIARRDTDQQRKSKLDNNQGVLNYGVYFTYRTQAWAATTPGTPQDPTQTSGFVPRDGQLYIPDLWLRYEQRNLRIEVELAAYLGSIGNRALAPADVGNPSLNQSLKIYQFGGVAQAEYRALNDKLSVGLELGFASGDKAPGFGYFANRNRTTQSGVGGTGGTLLSPGPQYACGVGGCSDNAIRNFRFNRAYRIDLILWREILGGITDAFYVKPGVKYSLTEGLSFFGNVIYSQAIYAESTPSTTSNGLGVEIDVGARYETEDGFIAGVTYGLLFPLHGLQEAAPEFQADLKNAQALHGVLGIRF